MQKLSGRKLLLIGFTLFSMFFGAGNLIFPPDLGAKAGIHFWPAFLGLAISAVGLPVAGVVAVARAQGLEKLAGRVHPVFAQVFMILIYLSIGPCLAIPRTASTSFAMLAPLVGTGAGLQLGYSVVFFAAAFLVALQPEKLTRWLGRLLCPCLLVLILVLFGGCLLHPLAGQYGTPTPEYTSGAVLQGVLYGYQTMDTLAALNFGAIIALNIQAQGVTRQEEVQRSTILAGFVAGGLLLAVYAMLGHAGALTGAAVPGLATGADVLTVLADRLFGKAGLVLLAAIFVLACFNTCVGLIACVGEYFHTLVPSVPYPAFAGFFAAASMLISNLGLADILRLSVPVLNALYPVAILLICLSFVPELEQRHRRDKVLSSWSSGTRWCTLCALAAPPCKALRPLCPWGPFRPWLRPCPLGLWALAGCCRQRWAFWQGCCCAPPPMNRKGDFFMIQPIVHDPLFLAQKSARATPADADTARDLLETLTSHADGCVGMAANMIGVAKRIIAVEAEDGYLVLFNPVILKKSGPYNTEEGCLSLKGVRPTKRWKSIKVQYETADGKPRIRTFTGWTAQIIQHEIDHCDGILI